MPQTHSSASGSTASKKIRMTMACERCRCKKVKCDFAHPTCTRCQQANVTCSYDGSATQVDLFNFIKLNETVDTLQQRVQSIESDIKDVRTNTRYVANEVRQSTQTGKDDQQSSSLKRSRPLHSIAGLIDTGRAQWSLSLTPRGLRIDTNIVSLHDLYDMLLSGLSHLEIDGCETQDLSTSSQSSSGSITDSNSANKTTIARKKSLWKCRLKTFPLYSAWEPYTGTEPNHRDRQPREQLSEETRQHMMDIYCTCFLCLPSIGRSGSVADQYRNGTLDPLLTNTILAWTARHAAIYHDLFPGKDPNVVGEPFFQAAKEMLKDRFMTTNVDTMHSLIIMYVYAIGKPGEKRNETESEAYIYLGLAVRMCLDLKMHQEPTSDDPIQCERHRRFFWVLYFLETLCSIHSDRPFSLPSEDTITVDYPNLMPSEVGEVRWRVEFMIQRFRITRIYRDIIYKTAEEKPLLSSISALDKELQDWYENLPPHFKYSKGDINKRNWQSASFREQACIKLNFEYNFQLCQLYGLFLSKSIDEEHPSAIDVLSREVSLKAADTMVELLECWTQLEQLWCHFSLETLMMAATIYGNCLQNPNETAWAKTQLEKIANILYTSPLRHHKYVIGLVRRIQSMFVEQMGTTLELQETPTPDMKREDPVAFSAEPGHVVPSRLVPCVLDVASASSAFDLHKTNTICNAEAMQFSSFMYNTELIDYASDGMIGMLNGHDPTNTTTSNTTTTITTTTTNTQSTFSSPDFVSSSTSPPSWGGGAGTPTGPTGIGPHAQEQQFMISSSSPYPITHPKFGLNPQQYMAMSTASTSPSVLYNETNKTYNDNLNNGFGYY
ncbi:hypothetical protein EC973_004461 [Apophysomyces ossiformis]|uniref:Zn(2)-C6 fungal-type domain-containing protein n=1 Tax=Apophysomyces ossiformis TaxID=679940 RepID=A0A8H7ELG4_9FUNG|nr:hypothetical protein EC973_004461 [Apophysomyces ossiformis]